MGWFSKRAKATFEEYIKPRYAGHPIHYLEIGVWQGDSLVWMLDHVLTHEDAKATAVDPWIQMLPKHTQQNMNARYEKTVSRVAKYRDKCTVYREFSSRWLRQYSTRYWNQLDMVYVDGDHAALTCLDDIVLSWPLLKIGGVMLIDDYTVNTRRPNIVPDAVDAVMPTVFAPYVKRFVHAGQSGYVKTGDVALSATDDSGNYKIGLEV
jgi:predicted O-methyltransferase YrrM